jgi:hypothetical protein
MERSQVQDIFKKEGHRNIEFGERGTGTTSAHPEHQETTFVAH